MTRIKLSLPNGNDIVNPEIEFVAKLLAEPERYFTPDSCGETAVEYKSLDMVSYLGIRHMGDKSFSVEWSITHGPDAFDSDSIILTKPLNARTAVTYVGGMALHVPEASVISGEDTLSIVASFCTDGRVPSQWKPERLSQLPADVYYWGDTPG